MGSFFACCKTSLNIPSVQADISDNKTSCCFGKRCSSKCCDGDNDAFYCCVTVQQTTPGEK